MILYLTQPFVLPLHKLYKTNAHTRSGYNITRVPDTEQLLHTTAEQKRQSNNTYCDRKPPSHTDELLNSKSRIDSLCSSGAAGKLTAVSAQSDAQLASLAHCVMTHSS